MHALAAEEPRDCIAVARVDGASLKVGAEIIKVSPRGTPIEKCNTARFVSPVVRINFVRVAGVPLIESYDSTEADKNVLVSERAAIGASIQKILGDPIPSQTPQVPAGQRIYSGVFSVDKASSGYYAVIVDPTEAYTNTDDDRGNLVLYAYDGPQQKQLKFKGQWCGVVSGRIDCKEDSSVPSVAALKTKSKPSWLKYGDKFSLIGKDKPSLELTYVPPAYVKAYASPAASAASGSASDSLQRLLRDVSVQTMLANDKGAAAARSDLNTQFPHLRSGS